MNSNSLHTQHKQATTARARKPRWATPLAFLVTLLALPVGAAIKIPTDPLTSGVRVAPNILFILDDSGSMESDYMPDDVPTTSNPDVSDYAYTRNTLSYNPAITYWPWMDATGNRLIGGTAYDDVYSSNQYVDYEGVDDSGAKAVITSSGQANLGEEVRSFFVPIDTSRSDEAYLGDGKNYYRYVIARGGQAIVRGTYGSITKSAVKIDGKNTDTGTLTNGTAVENMTAAISERRSLEVTINNTESGNNTRNLNYWVYAPSDDLQCSGSLSKGKSTTCVVYPTAAGAYRITVSRNNNRDTDYSLSARESTSCAGEFGSNGWVNCTADKPNASRDLAAELVNYATWYSYFRTRNKAAKAGAAEAFNSTSLGNKVRVGYTSIWGRNSFYIPVGDGNDGRFVNNDGTNGNSATKSRAKWYSHLFAASASGSTPLPTALDSAGKYFSDKLPDAMGSAGPYGPETGGERLSCRQNFSILTTDGYWNGGTVSTGSSNGDGSSGDGGGSPVTNGLPASNPAYKSYKYSAVAPYKDAYTNTLADVAMRYWKNDLMTDLDNNVPSSYPNDAIGDDPAFWQHMVTFGISIGLKTSSGLSSVAQVNSTTVWPDPQLSNTSGSASIPARIDDLLHAAVNGRGSFVAATNPQAFANGLAAALAKINERTASFSNAGASDSTQLNTGTRIFTASYIAGRWTGLLRAESAVGGTEVWKTSSSGVFPEYASRKIYTRSGTLTGGVGAQGVGGGTTFPTGDQLSVLARTGGPANYEVTASENADYIMGKQTKEGSNPGQLRVRATVFGDVVNSSPAYVADSETVFIGANDGMLHAFSAVDGKELFAYVPNIINFGNLADLSRGDYEHRWFVDGPIAVSSKALSPNGAKNILVGTLGRGGKGLYALDVTNAASFNDSNVLWERSSTSATAASDNMGMVLGTPVLTKVRTGTSTTTSAVVLGNGINSRSDKAALLVLNMNDGTIIREIATDNTTNNGLFAPTGIYAADGKTLIYAYAGDLQGNVWKFDLTSSSPSSWSAKKIFQAEKTAGVPQPITGGIASAVDSRTNKRWIFFGTGSYMTTADGNDMDAGKHTMYGVMDDSSTMGSAYTRTDLAARTVTSDGSGERYFEELTSALIGTKRGWYVDLPDKGERIVQNAQIDGSFLVTASMMPSGNSCADASGSGYINAITPFPDMLVSGKSYFDLDGDGNTDDSGTSGKPTGSVKTPGMPTLPLLLPGQLRYQTSGGTGEKLTKGKPQWNRVSWREVRND